jgi:hypothetical protein
MSDLIPVEKVKDLIAYDPVTGDLIWKNRPADLFQDEATSRRWNTKMAGKKAGGPDGIGYLRVSIFGRRVKSHIIAWAIYNGGWPEGHIDHINQNRADNRISNLREATHSQNLHNSPAPKSNTSGRRGVSWINQRNKWCAQIKVMNRKYHLGLFDRFEDAVMARSYAEEKFLGEFAYNGAA